MINVLVLALGTLCIVFAVSAGAQVQTKTTTKTGQSSEVVRVERGEVIAVEGKATKEHYEGCCEAPEELSGQEEVNSGSV
jgi:hypothetical protein